MNPSFYLIALLSCGLTLVRPDESDDDQTALTKQEILDRNAGWKLSVDEVLDTFFKLLERTHALEKLAEKLTTRVAFSVTDPTPTAAADNDVVLKYETVITKHGADYDPATGIFTVDTPGLYYFTFFFHTTNRKFGTNAGLELRVNDDRKVKSIEQVAGGDYGDSAGNAVILDLAKGDLVKVVLTEDMCIKDEALLNTFTGFLLKPSCNDPPADDPVIRLVDGPHRCEGRLDVFKDDNWGTVCGDGWNNNAGTVVCRELGCGALISYSTVGGGTGPTQYSLVNCAGTESLLSECPRPPTFPPCDHTKDIGVSCQADDAAPVIRLVGGTHRCEGTLEVFKDDNWGTVCDDGWSLSDAIVVCRELGCGPVVSITSRAQFGQGTGEVLFAYTQCDGTESRFSECTSATRHACSHVEDAGVICQESD